MYYRDVEEMVGKSHRNWALSSYVDKLTARYEYENLYQVEIRKSRFEGMYILRNQDFLI